ncbi:MAG: aminoglycoside phosphotransferase family protein [Caldilineaceae bacterium]|nr:aminoglycoside phosphotransferase family protein [Caldilineaceae bacterium]
MTNDHPIDRAQAQAFLDAYHADQVTGVTLIGAGAWSRCFSFHHRGRALVIRFGRHLDDFIKDQHAYGYSTPALPIPQVLAIGEALDGYYAISTRAYGVPLEQLDPVAWRAVVPTMVTTLEAMRTADLASPAGWGGWDGAGHATDTDWRSNLLRVGEEDPTSRTAGWRARLASVPMGEATFIWGLDLLRQVARDDVPRALLHCDLINRNVLVNGEHITGVFDWGCARYGDPLYDLAWFEFWAPWHPNLDIAYLRSALERAWRLAGYRPPNQAARLQACYLHIGLDHLAYNAYLGDWAALQATADRMRALVPA